MDKVKASWKIHEKLWFFALLIFSGGFYGGYTYSLRGQVFANAQTANLVIMMLSLGKGKWGRALYSLAPFTAYMVGVILSEYIGQKHKNLKKRNFEEKILLFESLVCFLVGLMPASWPDQFCQLSLSFICAMQFNIFRKAEGIPMATTFCTNHIRQMGSHLTQAVFFKNEESARLANRHGMMILAFASGVLSAVLLAKVFGLYCIFGMTILHLFLWAKLHLDNKSYEERAKKLKEEGESGSQ